MCRVITYIVTLSPGPAHFYTRVVDSLSLFTKKSMNIGIEKYLHFEERFKRFFKLFPLQLIVRDHTFLVYLHFLL